MRGSSFVVGVVFGAAVWGLGTLPATSQQTPKPAIELPPPPPPASFDDARFSLSLQNVSLPEMLRQVSAATSLEFRYAAPPDVMLSASFRNAPLFPSLERALQPEGFSLLRDGRDAWLLRAHPRPVTALDVLSAERARIVAKSQASPPKQARTPLGGATQPVTATTAGVDKAANVPLDGWDALYEEPVKTGNPPFEGKKPRERHLALEADAREFPGVTVILPDEAVAARPTSVVRYTLFLRHVPEKLRLALDTPHSANLRVNGAILRRAWSGLTEFELSGALRPGLNSIEVRWNPAVPEGVKPRTALASRATDEDGAAESDDAEAQGGDDKTMAKPLLRYEWLSGNEPPPASTTTLPLPGGFRLLLGRSKWEK